MASRLLPRFQLPRRFFSSTTLPPLLWKPTDPCPTTTLHLLSWGRGSSGQLGGGVEEIRFYPTPLASLHLPVDFRLSPISGCLSHPTTLGPTLEVGISCGLFHSSLLVDGRFWIWGKGDGGRLGLGHENSAFVPTLNPNLDGVRMIALGGLHSTALTCDGEIFTWGYGGFGALGHSVYHRELLPRLVKGPWNGKISHLATSGTHTAAVSCTGELYTWGRDEGDGRLGLGGGGGPGEGGALGTPTKVNALPVPVAAVTCGGFFTMALTSNGQLWSWGEFRELEMPRQKDPAWQYVSEVPGESDTESPRLQCQFCKGNFTTTITRMKSHLGKIACRDIQICQCVPDSVVNEVREHIAMATAKKAKRSHIFGSSARSSSTPMGPFNAHAQQLIHSMFPPVAHNTQSTIYTLVKKKEKEETDNCIMEAIVDCCLSFNVLRNKSFQLAIEKVASHGPGYKLPSFETARTKLLGGLKERADEYVKNVRKNWEMTGCTVMSDGWTDRRNRPHLNLLVASPHWTVFVKSICTTGKRKDANYIADFIIGAIEEHIGANNVVQVIADNASNYTAVGVIIERKWPHLFKTNCAAHCIDLMLEDIDKIDYVQPIMDNARRITKFMYKFQHLNDLMKKYTHDVELKRPGATRFATQFLCLQSVLKQEEPLRFMVASNDWKELPQSKTAEGLEIASIILGVSFWGEGKEIVKVVEPLVRVLRLVDSEGSTLGYLYEAMDMVKEAIKVIYKDESSKWKTLWDIIDRRWNGLLHSPIHAAAAYLNPPLMLNGRVKFTDPEVKKGMDEVFRRMVPEEGQDVIYVQFGHYFRKSKEIFDKMAL